MGSQQQANEFVLLQQHIEDLSLSSAHLGEVPSPQAHLIWHEEPISFSPPDLDKIQQLLQRKFPCLLTTLAVFPLAREEMNVSRNTRTKQVNEEIQKHHNRVAKQKISPRYRQPSKRKHGKFQRILHETLQRGPSVPYNPASKCINMLLINWSFENLCVEQLSYELEVNWIRPGDSEFAPTAATGDSTMRLHPNRKLDTNDDMTEGSDSEDCHPPIWVDANSEYPSHEDHQPFQTNENVRRDFNQIQRELDIEVTLCHVLRMHITQLYMAAGYDSMEAAFFTANMTGTAVDANLWDSELTLYESSCLLVEKILNAIEERDDQLREQDWECAREYLEDLAIGDMWQGVSHFYTNDDAVENSSELSKADESNMQAQILEKPSFLPNKSEFEEEYPTDNEPMYRAENEGPYPLQYPIIPRAHRKGSKNGGRHVEKRYAKFNSSKKKRAVTKKKVLRSLEKSPKVTDSDYERKAAMMETFVWKQYPTWFKIMKLISRMRKDVKSSEAKMKMILTKHERSLQGKKRKLEQALTKNIGGNHKLQLRDKLNKFLQSPPLLPLPSAPKSIKEDIHLAVSLWHWQSRRVKQFSDCLDAASAKIRSIEAALAVRARYAEGVMEVARGGLALPLHKDLDWENDDDDDEEEIAHQGAVAGVDFVLSTLESSACELEDLQKATEEVKSIQQLIYIEVALCTAMKDTVRKACQCLGYAEEATEKLVTNEATETLKLKEADPFKALSASKGFIIKEVVAYMTTEGEITSPAEVHRARLHLESLLGDIDVG